MATTAALCFFDFHRLPAHELGSSRVEFRKDLSETLPSPAGVVVVSDPTNAKTDRSGHVHHIGAKLAFARAPGDPNGQVCTVESTVVKTEKI